jgi:hypothetical protein
MFRRIELIQPGVILTREDGEIVSIPAFKSGLMGVTTEEVVDAWIDKLSAPKSAIPSNARFYFTEYGWREIGKHVVAACQRSGQEYRVIAIKENAIDVVYQDEYQVAGQPLRQGMKAGYRRRRRLDGEN